MKSALRILSHFFLILIVALPVFAQTPTRALKRAFTGKIGLALSIAALGVAEASDYKTTLEAVGSGSGTEANRLLTNPHLVLVKDRLVGFKLASFGYPVAAETFLNWRMNVAQRQRLRPWMIAGNWVAAVVVGGVAYHNRQIYGRR